jgi:MtrB/PioB family decaheme-associated outer membrane protein
MMKNTGRQIALRQTAIALAVLAVFGVARAEDEAGPMQASVRAGVGLVSGDSADRALWGQYNGMRDSRGYGLLDFDYARRLESGQQIYFTGSNLGLDTRELLLNWKKQGDWKFTAEFDQLTRVHPYTVNTGMSGVGSTTPQVGYLGSVGSGSNYDLQTRRTRLGMAFSKWFSPTVQFEASLKGEQKKGERPFGIGMACPSSIAPGCAPTDGVSAGGAVLFVAEPVNSAHNQIEARVSYAGGDLKLNGGYYGSFFNNRNSTLNPAVQGTLNGPLGNGLEANAGILNILNMPVALPPDNQSHQFDLAGNYAFSKTTRANFKVAYTHATQSQDFAGAGLTGAPAGRSSLGATVDTKLALLGLTARPIAKLTLLADARYEDKNDKTPIAYYNLEGATFKFTNRDLPNTKLRGKLGAIYQFTTDIQGSLTGQYEQIDRGTFTPTAAALGISALRQKTDETTVRAELRKRMTDELSGALTLESANRSGSNWLQPNIGGIGVTDSAALNAQTAILMPMLADRHRNKARLFATWQPMEALALQFNAEYGKDSFKGSDVGLRDTRMDLFGVDASYVISENWNMTAYVSVGSQALNQVRPAGYILAFDNTNTAAGLGVNGKPLESLEIGGSIGYVRDKNAYAQSLDASASPGSAALLAAAGGLPDIVYEATYLKLFGKYALTAASALRVDAQYQRSKWNDWGSGYNGTPFVYSDNTTLSMKPVQNVGYLGVSYIYSWR